MDADKIILLVLKNFDGMIRGKTLLQKRVYFLSQMLQQDLGYKAHYYGPYSPEVEDGLAKLKALGFVEERGLGFGMTDNIGFEVRRYDYALTKDGQSVLDMLIQTNPGECEQIKSFLDSLKQAGDTGDYVELSIAAKTHHILNQENKTMTPTAIRESASKFGWKISEEAITKAANLLEKLNLAQRQ